MARVRTHGTICTPHSVRSPIVGSSPATTTARCELESLESSSTRRNEESGQEEREMSAQRKGIVYGSQKAVDKVGDGIRFYSIIVGESKSVRVGPLSSGFL